MKKKRRISGILMIVLSSFLLVSLPLLNTVMGPYFWMNGRSGKDYGNWLESAGVNDKIVVVGRIVEEEDHSYSFFTYYPYRYRLVGSDYYFHSEERIGFEGDWVKVRIRITPRGPLGELIEPHWKMLLPIVILTGLTFLLLISGVITTILSFRKEKWKYDPDRLVTPLD